MIGICSHPQIVSSLHIHLQPVKAHSLLLIAAFSERMSKVAITGVFAWLAYASARNAAAATAQATVTAQAIATATANFTAKGTATVVSNTTKSVVQDGQNRIYSLTVQDVSYADITGSFTSEETLIVHPDNTASFSGRSICTCTVAGKSGTLTWSFAGTSTANGSFQGQFFDLHGTGDLAKLHGQGVFQGQGDHETYTSELYFEA